MNFWITLVQILLTLEICPRTSTIILKTEERLSLANLLHTLNIYNVYLNLVCSILWLNNSSSPNFIYFKFYFSLGPFLPCQDLFDWWTLRCGVWIVFLLAMLGNGTVVFVLIFSRSKMDVPRFLVCNLAAADFFMGIYLGEKAKKNLESNVIETS